MEWGTLCSLVQCTFIPLRIRKRVIQQKHSYGRLLRPCVIAAMNLNLNLRTYHFEYSISRPIRTPWFAPVIFSVGLIYVIVITLVNVIAVGYDTINYNSIVYNETHSLWYDKLVPFRGPSYNHRSCEPALLKLNDCGLIQV
jgi:hypothetical protein